eukprot:s1145_g1.t1
MISLIYISGLCSYFPDSEAIEILSSSIRKTHVSVLELGCGCRCRVVLHGASARCCCQSAVIALELGCWCRCRVPLQGVAVQVLFALEKLVAGVAAGAAAMCCCKVLLSDCCLRLRNWLPVSLQGAAACKVLLPEWCLRFGAWLLVPLQGGRGRVPLRRAAVGVLFVLWGCLLVPLQGAALWSYWLLVPLQGVAAGWWCKVLRSERCLHFGAWLLVPLRNTAARCHCEVRVFFVLWSHLELGCAAVRALFAFWNVIHEFLVLSGVSAGAVYFH